MENKIAEDEEQEMEIETENKELTSSLTSQSEEGTEVEIIEFALYLDEIDDLIQKLQQLKQTKDSFEFDIDEENALKINYLE